jgi:hypothetical protein
MGCDGEGGWIGLVAGSIGYIAGFISGNSLVTVSIIGELVRARMVVLILIFRHRSAKEDGIKP